MSSELQGPRVKRLIEQAVQKQTNPKKAIARANAAIIAAHIAAFIDRNRVQTNPKKPITRAIPSIIAA